LICVIATPFSWFVVWGLLACGHYVSWLLALALLLPSIMIALFLSPIWIKVLAGVIIILGQLALFISLASLLIFPFRKPLRWFLLELLDRAVSSEKGFVAFCGVLLATFGALAVGIVKLMGGKGLF
jgi:hypothetical protein